MVHFTQFVVLENLSVLDLALSGVKGLKENNNYVGQESSFMSCIVKLLTCLLIALKIDFSLVLAERMRFNTTIRIFLICKFSLI